MFVPAAVEVHSRTLPERSKTEPPLHTVRQFGNVPEPVVATQFCGPASDMLQSNSAPLQVVGAELAHDAEYDQSHASLGPSQADSKSSPLQRRQPTVAP